MVCIKKKNKKTKNKVNKELAMGDLPNHRKWLKGFYWVLSTFIVSHHCLYPARKLD